MFFKLNSAIRVFLIATMLATLGGFSAPVTDNAVAQNTIPMGVGAREGTEFWCQASAVAGTALATGAAAGMAAGPIGAAVGALAGGIIGLGVGQVCDAIVDSYPQLVYEQAYQAARSNGEDPGKPVNGIQNWAGVELQIFDNGAIINHPSGSPAYFVGGARWQAYQYSVNTLGVSPGYPSSRAQDWNGVYLQFFEGGAWGNGAIIGTSNPWLVTGNHWQAYWDNKAWSTLGNPVSFVYQSDGKYRQDFERGHILELAGQTWVNPNSTDVASEGTTPKEIPPVGRQADPPVSQSNAGSGSSSGQAATCNDGGKPVITSPLTVSPMEADTSTPITFTVTITNTECGTFAPENLAIGGYYADGAVIDVEQFPRFSLAPGASQTLTVTKVREVAGQQEYAVAYKPVGRNWHPMYDANGSRGIITQNVLPAGQAVQPIEPAPDTGQEVNVTETAEACYAEPYLSVFEAYGDGTYDNSEWIPFSVQITNGGCAPLVIDSGQIISASWDGGSIELDFSGSVIEPGETMTLDFESQFYPGTHDIWVTVSYDGITTELGWSDGSGAHIYLDVVDVEEQVTESQPAEACSAEPYLSVFEVYGDGTYDNSELIPFGLQITNAGCAPLVIDTGQVISESWDGGSVELDFSGYVIAPGETMVFDFEAQFYPGTHDIWVNVSNENMSTELTWADGSYGHIYLEVVDADAHASDMPAESVPVPGSEATGADPDCRVYWSGEYWTIYDCYLGPGSSLGEPLIDPYQDGCTYYYDGNYYYLDTSKVCN